MICVENINGGPPCTPLGFSFNSANNQITSTGYTYDAAGNLLSDNTHGYVYDAENRLTCVLGTDGTCTSYNATLYLYDVEGQRVGKQQANTLEDYVYDSQGHISSVHDGLTNLLRTEFYSGGRHVATNSSAGLYWNHADWLGTERVRTNSSGTAVETCTDTPYGMNLGCITTQGDLSPMHFTGKQHDPESGLDNFGARYYGSSNALGRFMSPDWSAKAEPVPYAKLDNPQSLNLYAYVLNNPLRNVDRDGHCDSSANATANTKCQDVKDLHVNDAMKDKIKQSGTKGDPALKVYKDGAGNLTVGWGHKVTDADGLKEGDTIKTDQAQKFFDSDLSSKESAVANVLTSNGGHQFSQGEFNALVDLTYNGGPGMLTTSMSPNLMKDMNAGDYTGMSGQLRYTKDSAGNVEPGLVTRSDDRQDIFLGADPDSQ
jgi:RHS repeat-associated protein